MGNGQYSKGREADLVRARVVTVQLQTVSTVLLELLKDLHW